MRNLLNFWWVKFSHKPSFGLIANSDIRRLLTKEDLERFIEIDGNIIEINRN